VVLAALRNALRVVGKKLPDVRVVLSGAGAAGVAIIKILQAEGAVELVACDRSGVLHPGREGLDASKRWVADHTNPQRRHGSLRDALDGADVFIGVSGPNVLEPDDLATMADRAIVFALANPDPEVDPAPRWWPPAAATSPTRSTTCSPSPASSGERWTPGPAGSPRR
jgi:malate dehydrogenase (oxaloacetate-decarboxylating)